LLDAGGAYIFATVGPGGPWTEIAALVSPDPELSGHFGRAVAISDDLAIVGAPSQGAQGIPGAGSVYVYEALGGDWHLTDTWNASNAASADGFGRSLALAPDRALVAAFTDDPLVGKDVGSVYRFERFQGGPWVELEQLGAQASQAFEYFGSDLSLQDDLALIGAFGHDDGYAIGSVESLAFDAVRDTLYGSDTYRLFTVDRATGAGKPVGSFGGTVAGLAFAADTNTLYGTDLVNDQLVRVDPSTGTQQPIGPLGFDEVQGVTYDPVSATLYGADLATDQLLEIDVHTGAASPVGPLGFTRVYCLALDPNSGVMYACDAATDQLLVVEPTTGAGSPVGPLVFKDVRGLAMDSLAGVLYGANRSNGLFLEIDPRTAACTLVGPFHTLVSNIGAAWVYGIY
jgi:hypothetical protein